MSTINSIPDSVFYDPDSWIDLAPDYDWSKLLELVDVPGDYEDTYTTTY